MREEKLDLRAYSIYDKISTVIRQIESGEIKPSDVVYCSKACKDVVVLENPPKSDLLEYHKAKRDGEKYPPFPGDVKYRTFSGQICSVPVGCIDVIEKGNKFVEYEVKGRGSDSKNRADFLEYYARCIGFRVKKIKTKKGISLTFFGDKQLDLELFLVRCCQNDLIIW